MYLCLPFSLPEVNISTNVRNELKELPRQQKKKLVG